MECDEFLRWELISKNYGVGFGTSLSLAEKMQNNNIIYIPISEPECINRLLLYKRKNRYYSPAAKEFEQKVIEIGAYLTGLVDQAYHMIVESKTKNESLE